MVQVASGVLDRRVEHARARRDSALYGLTEGQSQC